MAWPALAGPTPSGLEEMEAVLAGMPQVSTSLTQSSAVFKHKHAQTIVPLCSPSRALNVVHVNFI